MSLLNEDKARIQKQMALMRCKTNLDMSVQVPGPEEEDLESSEEHYSDSEGAQANENNFNMLSELKKQCEASLDGSFDDDLPYNE